MGEFADDAADQALNGNYWWPDDEYEGDDADYAPYQYRRRPTNAQVFSAYARKPVDPAEF